jgi:hypothetical protein
VIEHPYRTTPRTSARRRRVSAWSIALVVAWLASLAHAIVIVFDPSFAGPLVGFSIVLGVGIPVIASNARVLAGERTNRS